MPRRELISEELLHLRHVAWLAETGRHTHTHDTGLALCLRNGWCILLKGKMGVGYAQVSLTSKGTRTLAEMERDAARGTGAEGGAS